MSTPELVPLVVAVLVVLVLVGTGVAVARRRSRQGDPGDRFRALVDGPAEQPTPPSSDEPEPAARRQRHSALELRPLPEAARQRYVTAWEGVQSRFGEAPVVALSEADALLTRLLADRGFPDDHRQPQGQRLPAHQRHVLEAFESGHAIEQRNSTLRADHDEVRRGMQHFREVFAALAGEGGEADPHAELKVAQRGNG